MFCLSTAPLVRLIGISDLMCPKWTLNYPPHPIPSPPHKKRKKLFLPKSSLSQVIRTPSLIAQAQNLRGNLVSSFITNTTPQPICQEIHLQNFPSKYILPLQNLTTAHHLYWPKPPSSLSWVSARASSLISLSTLPPYIILNSKVEVKSCHSSVQTPQAKVISMVYKSLGRLPPILLT